jgi:alpha-1,2-mannosyltransferase
MAAQSPQSTREHHPRWHRGLAVLGALAVSVALALLTRQLVDEGPWTTLDLQVFHASGIAVWNGDNPYLFWLPQAELSLVYPPFAGLLLAPLALLPLEAVRIVWFAGIFLALQGIVWLVTRWVGVRRGWVRAAAALAAAGLFLVFDPGWQELWSGQVNTFLALLIVADLCRRDGARGRGIAIGIAAGIKLTPGLFILYFLLTRRFREAWTALATFAATVAVGFAAMPGAAWSYWTSHAWDADRIHPHPGIPLNQNLRGTFARLLHDPDVLAPWLVAAVVVLAGGLAACVVLHRRGLEREAAVLVGVVALLVSPVSWAYHWVWLVPALVVLGAFAVRTRSWTWGAAVLLVAATAFLAPYTWIPIEVGVAPATVGQQLATNSLTAAGLLLLVMAALATRSPHRRVPDTASPVPASRSANR